MSQPEDTLPLDATRDATAIPDPDVGVVKLPGVEPPEFPLLPGENQLANSDFTNYGAGSTSVPGYTLGASTALLVVADPVPLHGPNCVRLTRTGTSGTASISTDSSNRAVVDPIKHYAAQTYYLPGATNRALNFYVDWYNSSGTLLGSTSMEHRTSIGVTLSVAGASTTDGALTPSTTYYYRLTRLVSSGQESAPSSEVSVALGAGHNTANLSWTTTNTDTVMYRVYRASTSGGPYQLLGDLDVTQTTFSDVGLLGMPVNGLTTTRVNQWVAYSTPPTKPPAGATRAGIRLEVQNVGVGEYHYIDSFQLQEGTISAYVPKTTDEVIARAVRSAPTGATGARFDLDPTGLFFKNSAGAELVGLDVVAQQARFKGSIEVGSSLPRIGGANLLTNPSFELAAVSGGTPTGHQVAVNSAFTQSLTAVGRTGGYCGILSSTVTGNCSALINNANRPAVDANEPHVGSVYVQRDAGTARQARVDLVFYKSDGTLAGSNSTVTNGIATGTPFTVTGSWERLETAAVAPSDAASARVTVNYLSATANTDKLRIDDAQLEEADIAAAFTPIGGQTAGKVKSALFEGSTFRILEGSTIVGEIDGTVGVEFLSGTGTNLDTIPVGRRVQWRNASDVVMGDLVATDIGSSQGILRLTADTNTSTGYSLARFGAQHTSTPGSNSSRLDMLFDGGVGEASAILDFRLSGNTKIRRIADTNGLSSFMQMAAGEYAQAYTDYGNLSISVAAGASQATSTITHSRGVIASNIQLTTNNADYIASYESNGLNSFVIRVRHKSNTVGAATVNVSWVTISALNI